uniref:Paired box 4 n=1 Tax=Mola mola TaxID=94237 RepID=A0A3Q3VU34_MOLML
MKSTLDVVGIEESGTNCVFQVSNGCVSKILSRYRRTGLLEPRSIGGSRPRILTPGVISTIIRCKRENPSIFAWEIRKLLEAARQCKASKVPSVSSINRILRKIHVDGGPMCLTPRATMTSGQKASGTETAPPSPRSRAQRWSEVEPGKCLNPTKYHSARSLTCTSLPLESEFSQSQYADMYTREKLSAQTRLPEDTIKVWFSNRRAKWRREAKLRNNVQSECVDVGACLPDHRLGLVLEHVWVPWN